MATDVNCMQLSTHSFNVLQRDAIVSVGTSERVHKNYILAKTLSTKQADATYYPTCFQYWPRPVAKSAHSQLYVNIGFSQQICFGFERQFSRPKGIPCFCTVSLNAVSSVLDVHGSEWEREEAHWQREEKRWIREEQRWLREEARWNTERKALVEQCASLVDEIKVLKNEISQLQKEVKVEKFKEGAIPDLINGLTSLLHSLKSASARGTDDLKFSTPAQISNAASLATNASGALNEISQVLPVTNFRVSIPADLGTGNASALESTEVYRPEKHEGSFKPLTPTPKGFTEARWTFKRGSEGDDVKLIQDALAKLGFYSGEEDMEYSTFSGGTDRAVRAWQATLGISEDGILTTDLMEKLFKEETPNISGQEKAASVPISSSDPPQAGTVDTGDAPASTSKSPGAKTGASAPDFKAQVSQSSGSNVQNAMPKASKSTYSSVDSQKRVYLLGENRWEDPDRLISTNGPSPGATMVGKKCFSCKGAGSMMCTECEGTGELNVEEQFLEWVEEGTKCPYCEGEGSINCDVCNGKGV